MSWCFYRLNIHTETQYYNSILSSILSIVWKIKSRVVSGVILHGIIIMRKKVIFNGVVELLAAVGQEIVAFLAF